MPTFEGTFDYEFTSLAPPQVRGTVALALEVSEPNGWRRRLPLQAETAFVGNRASASGTVDMRIVRRMISLLEDSTTVDRDAYWLDILAEVNLEGELDGHAFQASFLPRLPFALDDHQLYLRAGDSLDAADSDPTRTVTEGSVSYVAPGPARLTLLGLQITVSEARAAAVVGLLVAIAGGVALVLPTYHARRAGRAARILSEYGHILVSVSEPLPAPREGVIEVQDFDDLARLSERTGRTILHAAVDGQHHFFLRDGEVVYHARLADSDPAEGP